MYIKLKERMINLSGVLNVNGKRGLLKQMGKYVRGSLELFKTILAKTSNMGKGKAFQKPLP